MGLHHAWANVVPGLRAYAMKIVGLSKAAFVALLPGINPKLKWNETEAETVVAGKPTFQGWMSYKGYATNSAEGYVHKGGAAYSKPCGHVIAKVVCTALSNGASAVWAEKHKFHKGHATLQTFIASKVKASLYQKKQETCFCGSGLTAQPTIGAKPAFKPVPAPTVPTFDGPAVPLESTTALVVEPITGAALTDGTGDASTIAKGQYREVQAAVTSLYVLQEVGTALRMTVQAECDRRFGDAV